MWTEIKDDGLENDVSIWVMFLEILNHMSLGSLFHWDGSGKEISTSVIMTTNQDIDYKNNCFEYLELSKFHDEPTTSALLILCNEVQSNTQSINTILGGGANGHLGLICNASMYFSIPGMTPYFYPTNPGSLAIPDGATQFQIAHAYDQHEENL
eukprot:874674-Ditylum_brightwellii.AAC.1